ncbi:MAG: ABC transporter ATP-binding protein/permease [Defluviitaleaceae bacterium]|nr:ABC transporter ATP-binding protein/permease [Defluviitaleaceae bacterium]
MKKTINTIVKGLKVFAKFPKPVLLSSMLASMASSVTPFVNLYMSAQIINELVGNCDREQLLFLVILTIGLNLLAALVSRAAERWMNYHENQMWTQIYCLNPRKLLTMDFADVEDPKIQERHEAIQAHQRGMGFGFRFLYQACRPVLDNVMRIILSIAFAFSLFTLRVPEDSPLAWLDNWYAVAGVIVIMLLSVIVAPLVSAIGMQVFGKASEMNNEGNRIFSFYYWQVAGSDKRAKDVRIYSQQNLITRESRARSLMSGWLGIAKTVDRYDAAGQVLGQLANGGAYLYIASKALAGAFPVGNIVQYVGAIFQFGNAVSDLVMKLGMGAANIPHLEEAIAFLEIENKKYQGTLPVEKRTDNKYVIDFKNVSFKYPGSEAYALKNLSLQFELGRKLAVVGQNGSGKTTMIKLLTRLYDPTEGEITLNGIPIWKYNYDEYMAVFGVVLQDFSLLTFTLGQNVAASTEYNKDHVHECLSLAGFDARLETMPKGLDTYLYKNFDEAGVEPSGGEEQKIALARALYKNAPFIVLDEPTAALDPIAEYEIYTRFNAIVGDKTAVYISHRLSSCRFCDDIIVFHEGNAIQRGTHNELLIDASGKYHELWNAQAQYYTDNDVVA